MGIGARNTASVVDVVYDTFDDVATVETVRPGNTAGLEIGDPFGFFLSILYDIDLSLGVTLDLFVEVGDDVIIDTGGPQLLGFDIDKTGILGLAGFNRFGPASLEGEDTGDTLVFVLDLEDGTQLETGVNDPLIIENASDHDINGDGFVDYAISVEGAGSPLMDALLTAMIEDSDQQFQLA